MQEDTRAALVSRLSDADHLVEVGIGNRVSVAASLVEAGRTVTATDVRERAVPAGVTFVRDDVVEPDLSVYRGAETIYALNLPPELHRPARDVAEEVGAALLFTTLGAEEPVIPVEREFLPGETLFIAETQRA